MWMFTNNHKSKQAMDYLPYYQKFCQQDCVCYEMRHRCNIKCQNERAVETVYA